MGVKKVKKNKISLTKDEISKVSDEITDFLNQI